MPPTFPRFVAMIVTVLLLVASPRGHASVAVLETFGPGDSVNTAVSVGVDVGDSMAMQFAVPAISDLRVRSITVALPANLPASQIDLVLDLAGVPSPIVLDSFVVPAVPLVGTTVNRLTVPAVSGTTLVAGQRYWLVWRGRVSTWVALIDWNLPTLARTGAGPWSTFFGSTWAVRLEADTHGACCNSAAGACTLTRPVACTGQGLAFGGLGTTCGPETCPAPTGACCSGTPAPQCTLKSAAACAQAGGTFSGVGTLCVPYAPGGPNGCCLADFNNNGTVSVQDIFDFLSGYFLGCP